ncbi:antA/AntB antirepressor family protein [Chryseobacterium sp. CT-SW4]|uniref:antA/AntB antirepressor family protein n=1 Tax=Chryseobacterium sp. SW-1 TaxID=3157343 RepID=UPI003B01A8D3
MEMIKITSVENGLQTVLATDLYKFLEPKTEFRHWIKRMFSYGFVEGKDFWTPLSDSEFTSKMTESFWRSFLTAKKQTEITEKLYTSKMMGKEQRGGHNAKEYILSLDCAKSISMVQKSEKGRQIRNYFIEAEKEFKAIATPAQVQQLYNRLTALESKQIDYANDWAVDRYLRVNKLFSELSRTDRQQLGKLCTKLHKEQYNTPPKKVPHPSYTEGQNVYPYELINTVFKDWKAQS